MTTPPQGTPALPRTTPEANAALEAAFQKYRTEITQRACAQAVAASLNDVAPVHVEAAVRSWFQDEIASRRSRLRDLQLIVGSALLSTGLPGFIDTFNTPHHVKLAIYVVLAAIGLVAIVIGLTHRG